MPSLRSPVPDLTVLPLHNTCSWTPLPCIVSSRVFYPNPTPHRIPWLSRSLAAVLYNGLASGSFPSSSLILASRCASSPCASASLFSASNNSFFMRPSRALPARSLGSASMSSAPSAAPSAAPAARPPGGGCSSSPTATLPTVPARSTVFAAGTSGVGGGAGAIAAPPSRLQRPVCSAPARWARWARLARCFSSGENSRKEATSGNTSSNEAGPSSIHLSSVLRR
mmetsp:Transcript_35979/g.81660  ORF Transcript_35979/g.81660 Transcript_35979/m.81660 type:complete len:225 (-) Transcript_35979:121-795(-)